MTNQRKHTLCLCNRSKAFLTGYREHYMQNEYTFGWILIEEPYLFTILVRNLETVQIKEVRFVKKML